MVVNAGVYFYLGNRLRTISVFTFYGTRAFFGQRCYWTFTLGLICLALRSFKILLHFNVSMAFVFRSKHLDQTKTPAFRKRWYRHARC